MSDQERTSKDYGWSHSDTRHRQLRAGLHMTPAERLAWLEEMLDELLPLVGRAGGAASTVEKGSSRGQ